MDQGDVAGRGAGRAEQEPPQGVDGPAGVPAAGELVRAESLVLREKGYDGFGPLDLSIADTGLTILRAPDGRTRTALLLALCGRMRYTGGTLTAFGRANDSRYLFDRSAVAAVDEVDGIEQAITVADVVGEQLRWSGPWYRRAEHVTADTVVRVCGHVFGDLPIPAPRAFVEELPDPQGQLLRVALADLRRPPLLVVGGLDRLTGNDARAAAFDRLRALATNRAVVTADVDGADGLDGDCVVLDIDLDGAVVPVGEGE